MPNAKAPRIPSYRLHKRTGCAVVRLNGQDFYLGPHGTAASRNGCSHIVGEWVANVPAEREPGRVPAPAGAHLPRRSGQRQEREGSRMGSP